MEVLHGLARVDGLNTLASGQSIVNLHAWLWLYNFEYFPLLEPNELQIVSSSPSLLVKRFHCISENSGRLIGLDPWIQSSQRSVCYSCKVGMDRIVFLIPDPK